MIIAMVLLAALGITAGHFFPGNRNEDPYIEKNPRAPRLKTWTSADGTTINLTYWKSEKSDPEDKDAYTDYYRNGEDQYQFDENGKFISFSNLDLPEKGEPVITEEQAKKIADRHIAAFYGDLRGYRFHRCSYLEADQRYDIYYALVYNDFLVADFCIVTLSSNGTVNYSRAPQGENFKDFDKSLLSGITKESLESYAFQEVAKRLNSDQYDKIELRREIWLDALPNGKYQIEIPIVASLQGESVLIENYMYPLS